MCHDRSDGQQRRRASPSFIESNLLTKLFHCEPDSIYDMILWGMKVVPREVEGEGHMVQMAQKKGSNCILD